MIIIGEKINGAVPIVKTAIESRDEAFISKLAKDQTAAGARYLDICAGTAPEKECGALKWLIDVVQAAVDTPLCIDSPDSGTIERVIAGVSQAGIVNSISAESERSDAILSLLKGSQWQVIAQTMDKDGIPGGAEGRLAIAEAIIEKAARYGIPPDRIHIDPLVAALSADNQSALTFVAAANAIKTANPAVKLTAAISNISFGMPLRKFLNMQFYSMAVVAGLDSAILDPCDNDMRFSVLAAEALMSRDMLCRNFTNAYRKNRADR